LTDTPIPMRKVYSVAWPLMTNALVFGSALIIDTIMVAPLGESSLAAMGLAIAIGALILGNIFALSKGSQILVAQAFGANDPIALKSSYWIGLLTMSAVAGIGILFIMIFGEVIISYFAQTEIVANLTIQYIKIFCFFVAARAVSQSIAIYFNGTGNTKIPLYANLAELPVNALLSYVLIYGIGIFPELGLAGAAIGSVVAGWLKAILLIIPMIIKYSHILTTPGWPNNSFIASYRNYLNLTIPIAATFISTTTSKSICLLMYAKLEINQYAAMTLVLPWINSFGMISSSWATAMGILTGQLLGNKSEREAVDIFVSKAWHIAMWLALLVSVIFYLISISMPFFYTSLKQETTSYMWSFLPILLFLPFTKTNNAVCGNILRAGGDSKFPMKVHMYSQWCLAVPLTALFILILELSVTWVFFLIFLEEFVKSTPFYLRVKKKLWMNKI